MLRRNPGRNERRKGNAGPLGSALGSGDCHPGVRAERAVVPMAFNSRERHDNHTVGLVAQALGLNPADVHKRELVHAPTPSEATVCMVYERIQRYVSLSSAHRIAIRSSCTTDMT